MSKTYKIYYFYKLNIQHLKCDAVHLNCLPNHQTPYSSWLWLHERLIYKLNTQQSRELHVAIQIYRGILKQREPANYNTPIYLCIYLDFLYTCRDVGCCRLCYLRPVWQELATPDQVTPFCIKAGLFILWVHNDAAVPVPKTTLFTWSPPALHRMLRLAGSRWCLDQECCTGRGAPPLCVFKYLQCAGSVSYLYKLLLLNYLATMNLIFTQEI